MCNNTKAISFWNFLKENTIEIPIVQRDYAQGRLGKENLRKNFLADLKNALDSGETMKLDFVYGSIENDNLNPLDGQQRLTTLWLLHWYIALRAGELSEDNCQIFSRFTYETRISSREFCHNLCNSKHFENFAGNDIVGFITKQTWFYSAWKQDPTIQSMLRMLGGTKLADKNGDDIVDGIEEIFQGTKVDGFKSYWEKLTPKKVQEEVIVFYHLPMKDFGLSDDLYIKMNARGKQLTSFENFKADLIGYVTKQGEAEWEGLLNAENGIPIKLDTDWTDIFWKNKSQDSKIDEIYFAFINRYFLQELTCAKKEDNTDLYSANELEENNSTFNYLYGNKSNDSQLQYSGLDKYLFTKETEEKSIPLSFFKSFRNLLNNFYKSAKNCKLNNYFPAWVDSKFEFIPKYDEAVNITTLGQRERIVFLAVCRYFEKGDFDETSFRQWMRVVWNIVENSGIETIPAMIGAMRLIDELSEGAHDIYKFLSNSHPQVKSNFAKDQVAEEIAKAKQILNGKTRPDGKTWEEIIVEAEKYAFFKGAIRFLFTKEVIGDDWCDFDTKWVNAQKYFDENGVKDTEKEKYKTDASLLKAVLFHVKDFWKYIEKEKYVFDNSNNTWKRNILLETGWENAVHIILMGELSVNKRDEDCLIYKNLYQSKLLNYVANSQIGCRIRWYNKHRALYQYGGNNEGTILDDDNNQDNCSFRNKILSELYLNGNIKLENDCFNKTENKFLWGWDIQFSYNGKCFQWHRDWFVRLIKDLGKCEPIVKDESKDAPEEKWYCFWPTQEMASDTSLFIKGLKELIEQSQKS